MKSYEEVRHLIEDGDMIAVRDNHSLLGKVTQFFTRDDETHTGVAIWAGGRLFMADLNSGRNGLHAISQLADFDVYFPPQGLSRNDIREAAFNWLADQKVYGVLAFLVIGFKSFFKIKEKLQWKRAVVCSGGTVQIFCGAGWDDQDTLLSPGELAKKLKLKFEVRT